MYNSKYICTVIVQPQNSVCICVCVSNTNCFCFFATCTVYSVQYVEIFTDTKFPGRGGDIFREVFTHEIYLPPK